MSTSSWYSVQGLLPPFITPNIPPNSVLDWEGWKKNSLKVEFTLFKILVFDVLWLPDKSHKLKHGDQTKQGFQICYKSCSTSNLFI